MPDPSRATIEAFATLQLLELERREGRRPGSFLDVVRDLAAAQVELRQGRPREARRHLVAAAATSAMLSFASSPQSVASQIALAQRARARRSRHRPPLFDDLFRPVVRLATALDHPVTDRAAAAAAAAAADLCNATSRLLVSYRLLPLLAPPCGSTLN